jgi:hypothetical protein
MKNLSLIMLAFALLTVGSAAVGAEPPIRLTKNYVINAFANAMTEGRLEGINDAIDQDAQFSWIVGKKLMTFNKSQMMEYFNANNGAAQDCKPSASVVDNNSSVTLVKFDMKYRDHIRSNYITMVNTGEGWKITNVYSVFK